MGEARGLQESTLEAAASYGGSVWAIAIPVFGGRGSPFLRYEQRVSMRRQVANPGPSEGASALILRVGSVARHVSMSANNEVVLNNGGLS